jgi:pimeloyl-ACP methyl ester carboxylesterase
MMPRLIVAIWMAAIACVSVAPSIASAQDDTTTEKPVEKKKKKSQKPSKDEEFDTTPRGEMLTAADGMQIRCAYYPSDKGTEAVPIMIVHGWGEEGTSYLALAEILQKAGFAVFVPDLRGHGGSTVARDGLGREIKLEPKKFGKAEIQAMIIADLDAVRGWVLQENNARHLNLNALTVLGVREGAIIAAHWAAKDWEAVSVPGEKQGQDVKALVYVSPLRTFKGVSGNVITEHPVVSRLPTQLIIGEQSPQASDAQRMTKQLQQLRDNEKNIGRFELRAAQTKLSGYKLVEMQGTSDVMVEFITKEVVDRIGDYPWIDRSE